jgi:hypothetical protein
MDDLGSWVYGLWVWNELMGSNYPPGVTGREWEIAGAPECGRGYCGHEFEQHESHGPCQECDCEEYTPYDESPDPW